MIFHTVILEEIQTNQLIFRKISQYLQGFYTSQDFFHQQYLQLSPVSPSLRFLFSQRLGALSVQVPAYKPWDHPRRENFEDVKGLWFQEDGHFRMEDVFSLTSPKGTNKSIGHLLRSFRIVFLVFFRGRLMASNWATVLNAHKRPHSFLPVTVPTTDISDLHFLNDWLFFPGDGQAT